MVVYAVPLVLIVIIWLHPFLSWQLSLSVFSLPSRGHLWSICLWMASKTSKHSCKTPQNTQIHSNEKINTAVNNALYLFNITVYHVSIPIQQTAAKCILLHSVAFCREMWPDVTRCDQMWPDVTRNNHMALQSFAMRSSYRAYFSSPSCRIFPGLLDGWISS